MIRNVLRSIIVNLTPEQAYAIWSDFESYPRFLPDVSHVMVDAGVLHCRVFREGRSDEWEAELIELSPFRRIAFHHRNGVERRTVITIRPVSHLETEVSLGAEFADEPGEPDQTRDLFDLYLGCFKSFARKSLQIDQGNGDSTLNSWI